MNNSEPEKFMPNNFCLLAIIKGQEPQKIKIPLEREIMTINGPDLKTEMVTETNQWEIDRYTTQFKNKQELLADIRANNPDDFKGISDEDILITMFYLGRDHDSIGVQIAYSDSFDLINLMNQTKFNAAKGTLYGQYADIFVENFKRYMIEKVCVHSEAPAYLRYMNEHMNNPAFYNSGLISCLLFGHDQEAYAQGQYVFNNDHFAREFNMYYNIRAHCLLNHDDLESQLNLETDQKNGYPTDSKESQESWKTKKDANSQHVKRSIDDVERDCLGDQMLEYPSEKLNYNPSEFTQDPEDEVEKYNQYYDDEPTLPINKENNPSNITKTYYDKNGQEILPIPGFLDNADEVVCYDADGNPLLFNPDEIKKR